MKRRSSRVAHLRALVLGCLPRWARVRLRRRAVWNALCLGEVARLEQRISAVAAERIALQATDAALAAVQPRLDEVLKLCRSVVALVGDTYAERRASIAEIEGLLASLDRSAGGKS